MKLLMDFLLPCGHFSALPLQLVKCWGSCLSLPRLAMAYFYRNQLSSQYKDVFDKFLLKGLYDSDLTPMQTIWLHIRQI